MKVDTNTIPIISTTKKYVFCYLIVHEKISNFRDNKSQIKTRLAIALSIVLAILVLATAAILTAVFLTRNKETIAGIIVDSVSFRR